MRLSGAKTNNHNKTKRIHMTSKTYDRFQYIAQMSNLDHEGMLNRLLDTWENIIYNADPLYNYDKIVLDFNTKSNELKTIFESTIRDSYYRYAKLAEKYHELQADDQLRDLASILDNDQETK